MRKLVTAIPLFSKLLLSLVIVIVYPKSQYSLSHGSKPSQLISIPPDACSLYGLTFMFNILYREDFHDKTIYSRLIRQLLAFIACVLYSFLYK